MDKYSRTTTTLLLSLLPTLSVASDQRGENMSLEDFVRANVASKNEIDVFLHEMSWAQFDPVVGYIRTGHYSPAGNHFFAYSLKDRVVDWLDPKPLPYRDTTQQIIDFKGYLQE